MVNLPANWQNYTGTFPGYGLVTAPAAGTIIASTGALPRGIYSVQASGSYGGVADVIDNLALFLDARRITLLAVAPVVNGTPFPVTVPSLIVLEGQTLTIRNVAAGGAGTVFRGIIMATPLQSQDL